jgi:hypothetical protein
MKCSILGIWTHKNACTKKITSVSLLGKIKSGNNPKFTSRESLNKLWACYTENYQTAIKE